MSLINDRVRRQFAEINNLLDERDHVNAMTATRSKLPSYTPTAEHEANLAKFKARSGPKWDAYGAWVDEGAIGDSSRDAYDTQLAALKRTMLPPTKTTEKVDNMRQQVDQLQAELLNHEEREIATMVADIERKQKRLNELEGLMAGLYEKQQKLLQEAEEEEEEFTTPPMSTTGATVHSLQNSDRSTPATGDRIERIERLLIHVLNTQERQEETIRKLRGDAYALSASEEELEEEPVEEDEQVNEMVKKGMAFAEGADDNEFVVKLLRLLCLVDTDDKRQRCLENIQNAIHNHYAPSNYSTQSSDNDVVYPSITDIEAVDLEYFSKEKE